MNKKQREMLGYRRKQIQIQLFSKYCFVICWILLTLFVSWLFLIMVILNSISTNKLHKEMQDVNFKLAEY